MGTDIHFVTQKKVDGQWVDFESDIQIDRDYFLFAWLGGVRNGYGFAGVKTFDPVTPLAPSRGLPDDFVVGVRTDEYGDCPNSHNGVWMGDHSYSWATSTEILSHYRPDVLRTGVVPAATYVEYRDTGKLPESWSGGIFGPSIVTLSPEQFDSKYGRGVVPPNTYVQMTWTTPFPLNSFIREVESTVAKHGEFRLVFGFDS